MTDGLPKKRFVGRTIPLVLAAFALAFAGVLVVDQYVEHRQIETSTHVAESTISSLRAIDVFGRALDHLDTEPRDGSSGQVALSAFKAAQSNLDTSMQDFERHLGAEDRATWSDVREKLGAFADTSTAERTTPAVPFDERVRAIEGDLSVLTSIVEQRGVAALRRAEQLHTLEGGLEAVVLFLLAGAAVSLLFGWRRAESRARERDAEVEEQLRRTLADLDAFAGRVAHDLRSPLAPILFGSQAIEREPVTDAVRRHAERIEHSARRLGRLIEGLLQFTRASACAPEEVRTHANAAVKEIVCDFESVAGARGARIDADLGPDCEVAAAPEVIQSIASNLVDNALKYGAKEDAPPRVTLRTRVESSSCIIEVEDAGPGIPPELRPRMFQPFVRGQVAGGGIGLGLSIVQRLVQAQRGRIEVLEGKDGGALFRIGLPLARDARPRGERSDRGSAARSGWARF